MKLLVLLSVLGLAVGCGTDASYTRTLASEEETEQTKEGNRTLKIAGVVAGLALGCVIAGVVKKKCISFAKKVAQNVEDVRTTKSVGPSKKVAPEPSEVSGVKPKQDGEPDLEDTKKTAKDSEGDEVKSSASSESSPDKKRLSEHLEEAGIQVSSATFDKLQKNMEDGSVFISQRQLRMLIEAGKDVLTKKKVDALNLAYHKGYNLIGDHYEKALARAEEIGGERWFENNNLLIAIQQLIDEGIFTDEIAKKVKNMAFDEWIPIKDHLTEMFK